MRSISLIAAAAFLGRTGAESKARANIALSK